MTARESDGLQNILKTNPSFVAEYSLANKHFRTKI